MSLIAEFSVPADSFALAESLAATPNIRVEVERLATHSREWVMPFVWASGDDVDAFGDALADDPSVAEAEVLDELDGSSLFVVRWAESVERRVDEMINRHAIVRQAIASDGEWFLKLRFAEDDQLSAFQDHFESESFTLHRKYRTAEPKDGEFGLTPAQRETLVLASEMGYFSVPRESTVDDIADRLDISANSVSQRLRRAHDALVRHTLVVDGGHPSG
ncbi:MULTISPECIES: bacterio-opsin activator domain-containing protein [Halorussus]|uniref:helix-turn-helix domain-containing protein n=1 Tax=Halorussus TaxID=1070314 RepID=UPI00209D852E|nr:bacterio-opsin activator domain-containing protein [Halorussus vallis]USZ77069.1 helix-turn-helix domain-containing protein [Halorussus vallis]